MRDRGGRHRGVSMAFLLLIWHLGRYAEPAPAGHSSAWSRLGAVHPPARSPPSLCPRVLVYKMGSGPGSSWASRICLFSSSGSGRTSPESSRDEDSVWGSDPSHGGRRRSGRGAACTTQVSHLQWGSCRSEPGGGRARARTFSSQQTFATVPLTWCGTVKPTNRTLEASRARGTRTEAGGLQRTAASAAAVCGVPLHTPATVCSISLFFLEGIGDQRREGWVHGGEVRATPRGLLTERLTPPPQPWAAWSSCSPLCPTVGLVCWKHPVHPVRTAVGVAPGVRGSRTRGPGLTHCFILDYLLPSPRAAFLPRCLCSVSEVLAEQVQGRLPRPAGVPLPC